MIRALAATATLATLGSLAVTAPATAHTPAITADCNGVTVKATNYDANATNRWTVTIAGVTQTGTFGATYAGTFPVPQAGATTDWSASIDAAGTRYDLTRSGKVGPCGTPPVQPPPPVVPPTPPTQVVQPPVVPKRARIHITKGDYCNCYRDWVKAHGDKSKVRIRIEHPSKLTWLVFAHGRTVDGVPYLLPSKWDGNSGWATNQVYKITTTNAECPCKKRGDCHELYPGYTPPANHCRPGRGECS